VNFDTSEILKCGAGEGRRSIKPTVCKKRKNYLVQ